MQQLLSQIVLMIFGMWALSANRVCAAEQTAILQNGKTVRGELRGGSAEQLQFRIVPQGSQIPMTQLKLVQFLDSKRPVAESGPLKRIWLCGGESFSGEIVSWSKSAVKIRDAEGGEIRQIPTAAIAAMEQLRGTLNLVYEDFENRLSAWFPDTANRRDESRSRSGKFSLQLKPGSKALDYEIEDPFSTGSVQVSFDEAVSNTATTLWNVEFQFETKLGKRVLRMVTAADDAVYRMQSPLGPRFSTQPLRKSAGWRTLELQFDPLNTMMLIDGNVLASGPAMNGVLKSIRWYASQENAARSETSQQPGADLWIDDFQITRYVDSAALQLPRRTQDVLLLATGDEIYGSISKLDTQQVDFSGLFGSVTIPWRELQGVLLRETRMDYLTVAGLVSRISLRDPAPVAASMPHILYAAIESAGESEIRFTHPVLGRCVWPLAQISKIEPLYLGTFQLLAPETRHLGDEIRPDFSRPEPDGQTLELNFPLDAAPAGVAYISLRAAHLEPSGPQALPTSPFLSELREGHLGTNLIINGTRIGRANDRINFLAQPDKPQRIRLRIPPKLLKRGENHLRVEQHPSAKDPTDYDDCEISRIALEIEVRGERK